jgi:hypothetical protein
VLDRIQVLADLGELDEHTVAVTAQQLESSGSFPSPARTSSAYARTSRIGIPVERRRVIIRTHPRSCSV